jgi:hypothetical protein
VNRRLKQAAILIAVVVVAAQPVRPERANPVTDANRTIQAQMPTGSGPVAVLDRSCRDCHSNGTVWPWYKQVAPLSWLMAQAVTEGRNAVNFSEWTGYQPTQQLLLLAMSCDDARKGKMPGAYSVLRPETRLSPRDVETICAAARQADARAAGGSR